MKSVPSLKSANISTLAFWDTDPGKIDMERDSLAIMNRVFNHGTWQDIVSVLKYYGINRVKKEIVHAAYLKKSSFSFVCLITGLEKVDFKAMNRRQRPDMIWKN